MLKIDLVIPMVFPQDAEWQREYISRKEGTREGVMKHARYRSWDTEELLVMCCRKYMPWLNSIYILLAQESQVQEWMRKLVVESEKLKVVFHRDFIPAEYLPCYASPCIEMFLNRIPGLSEHFIYANDDMFPLSPLEPEDFFRPVGEGTDTERMLPCQKFKEASIPLSPDLFHRKCLYQQSMIDAPFGGRHGKVLMEGQHSFAPILKSSCDEVWRRHGDEIRKFISPLKRTDRSCNHYIYMLYQHFAGLDVAHCPHNQYIGIHATRERIAEVIRHPQAGIVCINDSPSIADWKEKAAVVRREISEKLKR